MLRSSLFRYWLFLLLCHTSPASLALELAVRDAISEREVIALFFERNIDLLSAQFEIDRAEVIPTSGCSTQGTTRCFLMPSKLPEFGNIQWFNNF